MKPLLIRVKIMPFESLSSLIYRLTQANFYDRTGRIYRLIHFLPWTLKNQNLLSDRNFIKKLSFINNCSENEIFYTTAHSFARYFTDEKSDGLDLDAVKNFVMRSSTQYCPLCLKESGYHKIYWELLPVSICIKHEVILQNICPKCHRPVKINWALRNKCKCGSDLLSVDPVSVASYKEVIRNQFFIQKLLGINEIGDLKIVSEIQSSPATELFPPDFFKLLKIFSTLILKLPRSSKFLKLGSITAEPLARANKKYISNLTNFIIIHSAASILLDWPWKFYEFLEEYSEIDRYKCRRRETGVQKHFGGLNDLLLDKLDIKKFGFIYDAYRNYLNERWTGGHLSTNIKYLNIPGGKKMQRKRISVDEAAKILDISESNISSLVNQKIIQAIVYETKITKRYLIDAESVYALKSRVDRMLKPLDLKKRLNIGEKIIRSLVKSGLLSPFKIRPWSPESSRHFEPEEVERFEKEFLSEERYPVVDKKPEGYLSITEVMMIICKTGTNTAKLLQLVRQRVFNPILCKEGKGLSRLLFSKDQLEEYITANSEKKRDNNKFTVYRVGDIFGIHMRAVQRFINTGLIKATVENIDGKQKTYIVKKDLDDFKREYVFIEDAAALIGYNTETIFQWIKQGHLKDYSGISIARRTNLRILRRKEVVPFILKSMSVYQAAKYLDLTPGFVYTLIRKNVLPTLKGKGLGETSFNRIPLEEIICFKENFLKPMQENYMSVGQAAKYLGTYQSKIYRLIDKKILSKCKWKHSILIPLQELISYKKVGRGKMRKKRNKNICGL